MSRLAAPPTPETRPPAQRGGRLTRATWAVVAPWALLTIVVVGFLVPALVGDPDAVPGGTFLPEYRSSVRPEPLEQARYIALLALVVLLPALALAAWRSSRFSLPQLGRAAWVGQGVLAAAALGGWIVQLTRAGDRYPELPRSVWIGAAVAGVLLLVAASGRRPWERLHGRGLSALWIALALIFTALAVAPGIFKGSTIDQASITTFFHYPFTSDELLLVRAGQTPLVDVTPQYAAVLPYLAAPVLWVVGEDVGQVTLLMALLTAVAFLAVLLTFRRLTDGWGIALVLYAPVIWFGTFPTERTGDELNTITTYFALAPLRYLGPLLLLALVAWTAERRSPRAVAVTGLVAGLTVLNDVSFGVPAFGATLVGLALVLPPWRREHRRAAAAFAAGLLVAVVLVVVVSVARGGFPAFGDLLFYSRQFASQGYFLLPIQEPFGLPMLLFLTFTAAFVAGVVRGLAGAPEDGPGRVLVALLGFTGVFGLGAGAYFVGRSDPTVLGALFLPWGIALVVLAVGVVRGLGHVGADRRLLVVPAVLVGAHLALAAGSLADTRTATDQLARLRDHGTQRVFELPALRRLVAGCAGPGQEAMIVSGMGQYVALRAGVRDRFPFSHPDAVVTWDQADRVLDVLGERDLHWVFDRGDPAGRQASTLGRMLRRVLREQGFRPVAVAANTDVLFSTSNPLPPRATTGAPLVAWYRGDDPVPAGCGPA